MLPDGARLDRVEVDSILADGVLKIDVTCVLPDEGGWTVTVTVTSATPDPQSFHDTLDVELSVPHAPEVTGVRALTAPFRLEITGQYLTVGLFSGVAVGECHSVGVAVDESSTDTRPVLTGDRDLRKLFPKGEAVTITIHNIEGGTLSFPYTRGG